MKRRLMMSKTVLALFAMLLAFTINGQENTPRFPKIKKDLLLRDLELVYQGLDRYHSGTYWYTPKDSLERAFEEARLLIDRDMDVLEFHRILAPLVALCREDHSDIYLPAPVVEELERVALLLPLRVVFLGEEMYCDESISDELPNLRGQQILSINGLTPKVLVSMLGSLFASDGYIEKVKYSDLEGLSFARYFYYYFGEVESYTIRTNKGQFKTQGLTEVQIRKALNERRHTIPTQNECLELTYPKQGLAYLGIHTFSNSSIKERSSFRSLNRFLRFAFEELHKKGTETLIVDIRKNGGGNEGNEGLLYSYFGPNYQKYEKVRAKRQKVILDNGHDPVITLKTFGFMERLLQNRKNADGSYERRMNAGYGLMAYKGKRKYPFAGNVICLIDPVTYSGGSEFANMMRSQGICSFVGEETGGGYYGNTSGYSTELTLPHSGISIDLPALQFVMNVKDVHPFGRGVIPDYQVFPSIEQHLQKRDACLEFILEDVKQALQIQHQPQ